MRGRILKQLFIGPGLDLWSAMKVEYKLSLLTDELIGSSFGLDGNRTKEFGSDFRQFVDLLPFQPGSEETETMLMQEQGQEQEQSRYKTN